MEFKKYISPFAEITLFKQDIITKSPGYETGEEDDDIFGENVTIVDENGNPVKNVF